MKRGNIEHWESIKENTNLLLFAQLVNELLFDYSIPSNRIATLNSHFLCVDARRTIQTIELHGVPKGSLKPIIEELYDSLSKDVVFSLYEENPLKYFLKYSGEKYRISKNPEELGYEESKKVISVLFNKYFSNQWYYQHLQSSIESLVKSNSEDDWLKLFRVTKSYLTELVNSGYSIRYINETANNMFYSEENRVVDPGYVCEFLKTFNSIL